MSVFEGKVEIGYALAKMSHGEPLCGVTQMTGSVGLRGIHPQDTSGLILCNKQIFVVFEPFNRLNLSILDLGSSHDPGQALILVRFHTHRKCTWDSLFRSSG